MSVDPALREERDFLLGSLDDLEAAAVTRTVIEFS